MAFALDDYDILDVLGCGGFGTVYRARQKSLDRLVAIKCLSPSRTQHQNEIVRFRREAQAMAALAHDSIVSIFDYAYASGSYYLVMEYVDGISYDQALARKIPHSLSIFILEKIAGALACAHERGVIHRDLKGANILLGSNGQVKLADFGLAIFHQQMTTQSTEAAIGTLAYMAPEVMVSPREIDTRADIYSLGCILYQAFAATVPFSGESMADISYKVLNQAPQPAPVPAQYAELAPVIMQCLSKDREARPGIDTILTVLRAALRKGPEAVPESIASFVRTSRNAQPDSPPAPSSRVHAAYTPGRRPIRILAVAAAAVAAICAGIYLARIAGVSKERMRANAPSLQIIEKAAQQDIAGGRSDGLRPGQTSGDGPAPLTSEESETMSGTVIIEGLTVHDTVLVNGSAVSMVNVSRGRRQIHLNPGHYQITVNGPTRRKMSKELEVMPYQVVQWRVR